MFAHQYQTESAGGGNGTEWWGRKPSRTQRRAQKRVDSERISELRWQWRSVCSGTSLSQMIYTPSGATRAIPMIGQVDLGPPVSFTVRIRPGQTPADFAAAASAIASVMGAAALEITPLRAEWLRIVLVPARLVAVGDRRLGPGGEELRYGT